MNLNTEQFSTEQSIASHLSSPNRCTGLCMMFQVILLVVCNFQNKKYVNFVVRWSFSQTGVSRYIAGGL